MNKRMSKIFFAGIVILLFAFTSEKDKGSSPPMNPSSWKPSGDKIMTEWGEAITPDNVWKEYPRPQFVRGNWLNLNGLWDYSIISKTEPQPVTYQGKVLVPFCMESALSGVGKVVKPDDKIWYRRTFLIPEKWTGQKIILNFGAVDYETHVFVNKALVGSHKGGFDSFFFDIKDYLKPGENELVVVVSDPTCKGENPAGKQRHKHQGIWYSPVSGIWQTVWLEPVNDQLSLEELKVTSDIDKGEIAVENHTDDAMAGKEYGVKLTVSSKGKVIASALSPINSEIVIKIPSQHCWSPNDPFLYDLKAELYKLEIPKEDANKETAFDVLKTTGEPLDIVGSYFGKRKIALGTGKNNQPVMYLNNQPVFQNGVLDQGWWPDGFYTPPSEAAVLFEMNFLKDAGYNMLRKHVKVESARYYYNADKLGLLIWQDMPSAASRPTGGPTAQFSGREATRGIYKKASSSAQFELEYRNIISMLCNHPSIVTWVTFNEGWGQYDTGRLTDYVRGLDKTRLIDSASGWSLFDYGDIYDIHTYEGVPKSPEKMTNRAIVLGEYGGIKCIIKGHTWLPTVNDQDYKPILDKLEESYRKKFSEIIRQQQEIGISAAVYTQVSDIQGELSGLLTYDRKVIKIPAHVLKKIHEPILK
jgi:beta-galactosidase/beta-glucuronidase